MKIGQAIEYKNEHSIVVRGVITNKHENYIEYLEDSEFDKQKSSYQKNAEKTTVAGYTAVKGIYNNNMIYTLKVDGLKENMQFKMTVIPVNENDKIEDLINDSEVSAIISSLKIEEK